MARRQIRNRIGAVIAGAALALVPLGMAGAQVHLVGVHDAVVASHTKHLCQTLKAEQNSANNIGKSITSALERGNFGQAKRAMIAAINAGLQKASPALTALKNSPANVRSAMRTLIGFDNSFKSTIAKSKSLQDLESRVVGLTNSKVSTAATTVTTYITAQCGAAALPSTTLPASG